MATPRTFIANVNLQGRARLARKTSSAYHTQPNTSQPSDGVINRSDNRPVYNDPTDNGAAAHTARASALMDARVNDSMRRQLSTNPELTTEGSIPEGGVGLGTGCGVETHLC